MGGKVTCTLGEVKNRADFIVYWGGNPAECHPRHFTKYTLMQKSRFLPRGRKDRTMVLVDIRETKSVKASDIFLQIRPGKDFELITILRAMIKDQPISEEQVAETGLSLAQVEDFVARMKAARFGVFFFGMGLSMTRGKHMNSAALLTLAAEMNAHTKFVAMPMRGHGNVTGADVIMRWQTGYPFGISFNRGYPRYNPGEFSTVDVLVRGDTDCALIIGGGPGSQQRQSRPRGRRRQEFGIERYGFVESSGASPRASREVLGEDEGVDSGSAARPCIVPFPGRGYQT